MTASHDGEPDAASYIRHHAGEHEPDLTAEQRDLLGRVIARRIERGEKLDLIARAVAHALPELGIERARRLGRDETLRAHAWEDLACLRASGVTAITISAARDACPACRAAADLSPQPPSPRGKGESGSPSLAAYEACGSPPRVGEGLGERYVPIIPITACAHPAGCRCRYIAAPSTSPAPAERALASPPGADESSAATPSSGSPPLIGEGERSARPWYRPRPPRPHGPRWTEAERAARHPARQSSPKRRPRP